MLLRPDFTMPFGVNRGYTLKEIYQYLPSYIEWLIEYVPLFEIEISDFESLPAPTIYHNVAAIRTNTGAIFQANMRIYHRGSIDKIKNSGSLQEVEYSFPKRIIFILAMKKLGIYEAPTYQRSKVIASITIEELNEYLKTL